MAAYDHSKDRRPDHKLLVIGLLMTSDGVAVVGKGGRWRMVPLLPAMES